MIFAILIDYYLKIIWFWCMKYKLFLAFALRVKWLTAILTFLWHFTYILCRQYDYDLNKSNMVKIARVKLDNKKIAKIQGQTPVIANVMSLFNKSLIFSTIQQTSSRIVFFYWWILFINIILSTAQMVWLDFQIQSPAMDATKHMVYQLCLSSSGGPSIHGNPISSFCVN